MVAENIIETCPSPGFEFVMISHARNTVFGRIFLTKALPNTLFSSFEITDSPISKTKNQVN
jgi:hypothetical protein